MYRVYEYGHLILETEDYGEAEPFILDAKHNSNITVTEDKEDQGSTFATCLMGVIAFAIVAFFFIVLLSLMIPDLD